ncbi:tyrosine-type recombinase/integrase [Microbacterium sp. VKM Ac-2870]|uniref:tyrosine-type recombinase/integrase n=1 Tax=Microbacterium sp. VKM Ac-2870 TaxID=2783825 RepID=UPI00188C9A24|nr:site-specific integrase [Microbacterium sp. VKM Ac-2870]MBF4562831.1 tyrosine-type recombinase/integrase [Microbacterium sp. VKM Ac-2870]
MARPRTPIGSYGEIHTARIGGKWRARARYRFSDGKSRQVERFDVSEAKAKAKLREALNTVENGRGTELKPTTPLRVLANQFLEEKEGAGRSTGTLTTYRSAVKMHIIPKIGDLSAAEATPAQLQTFLSSVHKQHGHGAAKNCRSVLSGMLGMAVRNGAIARNPVKELDLITRAGKKGSEAIPLDELPAFLAKVRADDVLIERDMVDMITFMLSVGWRIAEVCALEWESVDVEKGTVRMEAIAVRVPKQGVVRQPYGKTSTASRTTPLPADTLRMLEARKERLVGLTPLVFPTVLLHRRDPSNAQCELRERRQVLGYPELTTHSFRKTVATALDPAGLSARDIAEYLGHQNPSLTMDVYMSKQSGSRRAADLMQEHLERLR